MKLNKIDRIVGKSRFWRVLLIDLLPLLSFIGAGLCCLGIWYVDDWLNHLYLFVFFFACTSVGFCSLLFSHRLLIVYGLDPKNQSLVRRFVKDGSNRIV